MKAVRPRRALSNADRFPHLAAFFAGYLHQDFVLDHQTPQGAVKAFLDDAGPADLAALRKEWQAFRATLEGLSLKQVRDLVSALGGAWRPASRTALLSLLDEL